MTRMKLTDEGMHKPLKGNVRGLAIQELFPTFEELFQKLPDDLAFNVEFSELDPLSIIIQDSLH